MTENVRSARRGFAERYHHEVHTDDSFLPPVRDDAACLSPDEAFSEPVELIEPTWESLIEHYEVPEWFVDGKIGVWTHWGISSAIDEDRPNDGSHYARRMYKVVPDDYEGELGMSQILTKWHTERYGPPSEFGYEKLIPLFKAENWDPDGLVRFFKDNGARFIMPVATHHDNFDMYDSFFPWNSVKMGPKRDTLAEWKAAAQKHGLKFGVSTHLYWSPRFLASARKYQNGRDARVGVLQHGLLAPGLQHAGLVERALVRALLGPDREIRSGHVQQRLAVSPDRGRKGPGDQAFHQLPQPGPCKENDGKQTVVLSFKDKEVDRRAFTYNLERGGAGEIKPEPWMWATDLSGNWFYRKDAVNEMSIPVMVANGVDVISKNGVVMLNVALRGDGTLPENQAAYLTAFGDFLRINAEGIYGTRPWKVFGEGPLKVKDGRQGENHRAFSQNDIRFTTKDGVLYAFVLSVPDRDIVIKSLAEGGPLEGEIADIALMGSDEAIVWERSEEDLTIQLPASLPEALVVGFRITTK